MLVAGTCHAAWYSPQAKGLKEAGSLGEGQISQAPDMDLSKYRQGARRRDEEIALGPADSPGSVGPARLSAQLLHLHPWPGPHTMVL